MKKYSILLVEDDEFLLQLYSDILIDDYNVTTAANGPDAYEKIIQGGWDLVLLDVMLPGMTGTDIVEKIQKEKTFSPTFPIVFLTNMDSNMETNKMCHLVDECWIKSNMNPPELLQKVKEIISK